MKIGIFGAGSIGCYTGGMLAAAGKNPVLIGRGAMADRLDGGITLSRFDSMERHAEPGSFVYSTTPEALGGCDAVLVCVKSAGTVEAGEALGRVLKAGTTVVSLQNGIGNGAALREILTGQTVLSGVVAFNVAQIGADRFHCGTEGDIAIEAGPGADALTAALNDAGIAAESTADIVSLQWGKLLLNLNNGVNALSGLPLKSQLSQRAYRQVLAASIREALAVLKSAKIRPAKVGRAAPRFIPVLLEMPDRLFTRLAGSMLRIDEDARSSMAEDMERGRPPEIDWLNGAVCALGKRYGIPTPVNDRIIGLVNAAHSGAGPRRYSGEDLRRAALDPPARDMPAANR